MNYRMIWQILGRVLLIEAALLLLPLGLMGQNRTCWADGQ